jgi:membrane-associated phospholipid phosphatase
MKFEFPAPITEENKWSALAVGSTLFLFGYMIPNRYHLIDPIYLPMTAVDKAVPLVPWTIIIYQSEYIFFWLAYVLIRKEETRNRLLYSFFAVQLISMAFFIFYPTTFPRHTFPLPEGTHPWIVSAFSTLHILDDPSNTFPSLHVSACFVTAFAFLRESKIKCGGFLLWSVLILISTMTTKQHYFIDTVAGLALAMFSSWFFVVKARYRGQDVPSGQLSSDS